MVLTHRLNRHTIIFWALALPLLLLPIGLGGNRAIPFGLMQIGLGIFFAGFAFTEHTYIHWPKRLKVALVLFAAVLLWGFVQTLSITPTAWHHPLWAEAQKALPALQGSISLTPDAGLLALQRLITYVLIGTAIYVLAKDPTTARRLITMFWIVGVALCAFALLQHWLQPTRILWLAKWSYEDDVTGTFVNRNHFADYAGLTFITGIALAWQSFRTFFRGIKRHQYGEALQTWFVRRGAPFMAMLGIVAVALIQSHSRAGLVCTLIAAAVFSFSYLIYQRRFKSAVLLTAAIAVAGAAIVLVMADAGRFATLFKDYSSLDRMKVYTLTAGAIQTNPWFGHGLGSFESAFRLYRDTSMMWGEFGFNHVHSDWLETAFDLGVPFALLFVTALAVIISGLWHGVRTRHKDGLYPALGLAASVLVLTHALVDFNMQMPGVVVSWLILLGCGLAQSWSTRELAD